jgi:hypothetical protein
LSQSTSRSPLITWGGADGIDALNIHLDEFGESVLIEIENEVMDEIESIANND